MDRSLQQQVRQRAEGICEYCRVPEEFDPLPFHIDHIIARKHGGPSEADNLALTCFACNNHKQSDIAGIDPEGETNAIVRLFHPRKDAWNDHFAWNGAELRGRTPIGRVTIYVLGMNLPHRVTFRQFLIDESVLPHRRRKEPGIGGHD